jgi:uncharacterized protein (DUF362 family)/Pyruvate/2-oxoacid:ferredoxin oxidoreductase delta subunit
MRSTVALIRCDSYEQRCVDEALGRGFSLLGGVDSFVKKGERILLKPNALSSTDPSRCVVTHPAIFKGVAQLVQSAGVVVSYGDSPEIISPLESTLKRCGYAAVAKEIGLTAADFSRGEMVSFPGGLTSKRLFIARGVLDSDGIVSLPKLKTHGLTRLTCAIKNQYGCVPGVVKGEYHARFPDAYDFSRLLADITGFVAPRLYIVDAVWAMEGNGPKSGDPKKLGALLLSRDPVALDAVCCRLIDLECDCVPTIEAGVAAGLGTHDEREIDLVGDPLDGFIDRGFRVVRMKPVPIPKSKLTVALRRHLTVRPVIDRNRCTRCGKCVIACPIDPKALGFTGNPDRPAAPPRYDYDRCIRCFCCQEMCPSAAITVRVPLMRRLLPLASYLGLLLSRIHRNKSR